MSIANKVVIRKIGGMDNATTTKIVYVITEKCDLLKGISMICNETVTIQFHLLLF